MNRPRRILFLTAPIGAGHTRAAQAVSEAMKKLGPAVETQIANVFDFFHPLIGQTILRCYLKILAWFPGLYGSMYGWGNNSFLAVKGRDFISSFLAKRMQSYIEAYQPDAIVSSHATPAGLVDFLVRHRLITIPSFAIVTDYIVHRLWVYSTIRRYFVAHTELCDYLAGQGIAYDRTFAAGIPVSAAFNKRVDRAKVLGRLNLDPDGKRIMIMGGGAGVLAIDEILAACEQILMPLQLIIVAGNNQALLKRIQAFSKASRHVLRPLGFVNNVDELMSIADLLISKPGGMTSAEALVKNLPMIIYKPIPGQEEGNTRYLAAKGAAIQANSPAQLREHIERLINNADVLTTMKNQISLLAKPAAAEQIARQILEYR